MTEEKVNEYCKEYINWLKLRQNDGITSFVSNNLSEFYLVACVVEENLREYEDAREVQYDANTFYKMNFFDKIDIIQNFFKSINMKIDVEKCIKDGTIRSFYIDFKGDNVEQYMKGHGNADENGNVDVMVPNSGLALDMVIMMHELSHSLHRLTMNCNKQTAIVSEAIALYTELQSYDYLNNLGYTNESKFFKVYRMKKVHEYASLILIVLTYINFGNVTQENFNKLFDDKDYYKTLEGIKSKEDFYKIESNMNYVFGLLLATYMYETVKNDFSFTENINILNKKIKYSSFNDNLETIGITKFDQETILNLSSFMKEYNKENGIIKK